MALKVGIVGCGNIGLELARFVHQHRAFALHAVSDVELEPMVCTPRLRQQQSGTGAVR